MPMHTPVMCEEFKKPMIKHERRITAQAKQLANVRPNVAELIKKVVNENSPTWKALAKQ